MVTQNTVNRFDRRRLIATGAGTALAALTLNSKLQAHSAPAPSIVRDMTAANLRGAFGGETMAYMRYVVWANHADKDDKPNIARLYRAVAEAEKVHADNHFVELAEHPGEELVASMAVFGLGSTSANLKGAIEGEVFEVKEMYPAFLAVAKKQNEQGAIQSFEYALEAEKAHIDLFEKAKRAADRNRDMELAPVRVCDVCGYTLEGDIPDECPICGHSRNHFMSFA